MKMPKFITKLLSPVTKNITNDLVDVGETLKQLKSVKERLELAKKQQAEIVAQAECNKLQNVVAKEERIRRIEDECVTLNQEEDLAIGMAEDEIEEAEEWLVMFPTKK